MTDYIRYAVYYAPPAGSALALFGARWLGWDAATGQTAEHPCETLRGHSVEEITRTPRKYGFHGTLKPPFRLADGTDGAGLRAAVGGLAARLPAFDGPPFRMARLGSFLALIPLAPSRPLRDMAAACVRDLDRFRAPPTEAELAKRRTRRLSPAQEANLAQWGYPYVLEEFRFHLTLTGKLDADVADDIEAVLAPMLSPLLKDAAPFHELCLFGESPEGRFHILERFTLTG